MSEELTSSFIARDVFLRIFNRLAVALRDQHDDSGVTLSVYYDALKLFTLDALEDSARTLATESGRKFMPTTAEWHAAATKARRERILRADAGDRQWEVECTACDDYGWEYFHCPGDFKICGLGKG